MEIETSFLDLELALIAPLFQSKLITNCSDDLKQIVSQVLAGDFHKVLDLIPSLLTPSDKGHISRLKIEEAINNYLVENSSNLLQIFCVGISSLQVFIQRNWMGIVDDATKERDNLALDEEASKHLVLDGECFFPSVRSLPYLLVAKYILHELKDNFTSFKLADWWLMRYVYVHQRVLEESSQVLNASFLGVIDRCLSEKAIVGMNQVMAQLHLETGYVYILYGEVQKAKMHFEKAKETVGFLVEWTGALGKRTRYQQSPKPQLTVRVHGSSLTDDNQELNSDPITLPKDILLDDDTRLNRIAFIDQDDNVLPDLPPLYQALSLAEATQLEKFHAHDDLLAEQMSPLLNCILAYPKVWSLHLTALVIRSKLESNQRRAVERSMTQLQELVDNLAKAEPPAARRLDYFYVSRLPLEWELQGTLADVFVTLGAINSALDIYLRLQMWDKVIGCYQHLEMKHKAEEIVRQELAKDETPKLWCILGDCTDDVTCYEKAWELSNHKSARAQRDWAFYFYRKKQLKECIPHFQLSVEINSLQEGIWIRLAFCSMEVEEWETAAKAYRRYCALNSESFEAWNNLAKCYAKLGQKSRAWSALQEAVKCQYENWKVWDNLMVISIDCCEYEEAIRSYHRIMDLKEKHIDLQVLRILVQSVAENKDDNYGQPAARLAASVHKLLGRLTAQVTNYAQVWEVYSDLVAAGCGSSEDQSPFRVAQLLQKAHSCAVMEKNWEKDIETCISTVKLCSKFINSCLALLASGVSKEHQHLASSAKLSLRTALAQVKRYYEADIPEAIGEHLALLENLQDELLAKLSS